MLCGDYDSLCRQSPHARPNQVRVDDLEGVVYQDGIFHINPLLRIQFRDTP
jgi:hypothetical protein